MRHAYVSAAFVPVVFLCMLLLPFEAHGATIVDADTIILTDTTWTKSGSPYIVAAGVQIDAGATLTIEAGTTVQFDYGSFMTVYGAIDAEGTATEPIVLTSLYDTGNPGSASSGDWDRIYIVESTAPSRFDHVDIRYSEAGIQLIRAAPLTLNAVRMSDNDSGIYAFESILSAQDLTFIRTGDAIELRGSIAAIASSTIFNTFRNANRGALLAYERSSLVISDMHMEAIKDSAIVLFNNSSAEIRHLTIRHMEGGEIISAFNDSTLLLDNVAIEDSTADIGVVVFNDSTLELNAVMIHDAARYDCFVFFAGAHIKMTNSGCSDSPADGIAAFDGAHVQVENSRFERLGGWGILANDAHTTITVNKSRIGENSSQGIVVQRNPSFVISQSVITGNSGYGAQTFDESVIDARSNFWGDPSGPLHVTQNPAGLGNAVSDFVLFDPWLPNDPLAGCVKECFSNVLFLPGIESSRLYRPQIVGDSEKQLWEPSALFSDDTIRDLFMTDQGQSMRDDIYTKEGAVLDELPVFGKNIYKSFIAKMDELKDQHLINDWGAAAYDWRLSLDDIVNYGNDIDGRIYYSGSQRATSSPYIIQELRRLAATSKSGKVTIIAHSNGGLVAKRLTDILGSEAGTLIDKIMFVAVPQAGTPMAAAAGLHGYDQANGLAGIVNSAAVARAFATTSPMFYNLLPSAQYFTYVDDPIIQFDLALTDWIARYGQVIHSRESFNAFAQDSYKRVDAETGDINQPTQLKESLLNDGQAVHDEIDNWTPPPGVELIQIAGWGIPTTVSGITYKKKGDGVEPDANFTIDGDGTVVVPSALWTSSSASTTNYWINLKSYNADHPLQTLLGRKIFNHANILETQPILTFLSDRVLNNLSDSYDYFSKHSPASSDYRIRYSLHSPLTLDAFDNNGNHTGVSTTTNQIEEGIPGSYYTEFGDVKYLFTDTSTPIHIEMNGYATSTFTFEVHELQGNTVQTSTTWKDMPVTPQTKVMINSTSDFSTLSPLTIDKDGDGTAEYTLPPVAGDVVTLPKPSLSVTAENKTVILGAPLLPLTAAITGFINGDTLATSDIVGSPSCSTSASGNSVGTYPIICTIGTLASDTYQFGTFATGTVSIIYKWSGFAQPINDTTHQAGQSASVFKAGSTVPVKFQLKKADGTIVQAAQAPQWNVPQKMGAMSASIDESIYSVSATTGNTFKWDSMEKQYIYNWSTKGFAPGYWYRISVKLDDDKIYYVTVGLR